MRPGTGRTLGLGCHGAFGCRRGNIPMAMAINIRTGRSQSESRNNTTAVTTTKQ